jgi:DNA-binding winged helix-turn-helix (wHTH) protein/tetratricopeptide (TPR) repeat protein
VVATSAPDQLIDLARTPPFRLGRIEVVPSARQMIAAGRHETLEPRVPQVLIALWQGQGSVVSRDELIARCWGGRIVGDNAIHRTVSRLRDLAEAFGPGAFDIETIPRVGYRLSVGGEETQPAVQAPAGAPRGRIGRVVAGAVALLALAMLAAVFAPSRPGAAGGPVTVVMSMETGEAAESLMHGIDADLTALSGGDARRLAVARDTRQEVDYIARVSAQQIGPRLAADLQLAAPGQPTLLWSASFDRPASEQSALRGQMSTRLGGVLLCAAAARDGGSLGGSLDVTTLRLYLTACDRMRANRYDPALIGMFEEILQRAPEFALALADLAYCEASQGEGDGLVLPHTPYFLEMSAWRAKARRDLERARRLDPHLGASWAAEAVLLGDARWADMLALVDRGLQADPKFAPLLAVRAGTLEKVGRLGEAIAYSRRAVEEDPLSPELRADFALGLAFAGNLTAARRELGAAEQTWPDNEAVREARFIFGLRYDEPRQLIRAIDAGDQWQNVEPEHLRGPDRALLEARASGDGARADAAIRSALGFVRRQPRAIFFPVQTTVQLGRVDLAFRLLEDPRSVESLRNGSEVLFRSYMRPLRVDRRFMTLAARLGLARYWLQSGSWPDFCGDPELPYDCRAEARRALEESARLAGAGVSGT